MCVYYIIDTNQKSITPEQTICSFILKRWYFELPTSSTPHAMQALTRKQTVILLCKQSCCKTWGIPVGNEAEEPSHFPQKPATSFRKIFLKVGLVEPSPYD